jgi:hypothetical protein
MRSSCAVVFLAFSVESNAQSFEVGLWPGEGIPVLNSVTAEVPLRREPSSSSAEVTRVAVSPGLRVEFDDTRVRTIRPGRITVIADARVRGRNLGQVSSLSRDDYYRGSFAPSERGVVAGEVIEYLQYRAEGTCFVRVRGNTIDAQPCPVIEAAFRVDSEPEVEWWVHATIGSAAGWVLIGDEVRVVDREF